MQSIDQPGDSKLADILFDDNRVTDKSPKILSDMFLFIRNVYCPSQYRRKKPKSPHR